MEPLKLSGSFALHQARTETVAATALAIEFVKRLAATVTPDEFLEIEALNGTEEYPLDGACASHNFCDANQVMIDAMAANGVEYDACVCGYCSDIQNDLINRAWSLAREFGFNIRTLQGLNR